jgi:hypothetical protein
MTDGSATLHVAESSVAAESRTPNPSKARRRFLLAAGAALPSVYTLNSGAQTAIASNLACWAKEPKAPPVRFTSSNDNWLRAQVYTGDYNGTPADCVSSPQAECIARSMGRRFDPNAPAVSDNAGDGSVWIVQGNRVTSGPTVQITKAGLGPPQYGLVYVDETGSVATLDPKWTGDLRMVTQSCWTSVLGGRVSKLG